MSEHIHTFTELDKQIQDGFNRFNQGYSTLGDGVYHSYVQGFLDGIKSIDKINEAYKLDIKQNDNDS